MKQGAGSLRRRLTIWVVTIVGLALTGLSVTLYLVLSQVIRKGFDERLVDGAHEVAMLMDEHEARPSELDTASMATLDQTRGATSYQVWMDEGSLLAHFPATEGDLPRPTKDSAPVFTSIQLPSGRPGRLYQAWFELREPGSARPSGRRLAVAVARDTGRLERRLARIRWILWGPTLGAVVLAGFVASLVIRRSLRNVARMSTAIASIDAFSLGRRLQLDGLPDELRPPFAKLNELLARIEDSMARERQFSADVSHELRTPLSGLRTILEVSASRDRPGSAYRAGLTEALEVVRQIEAIVENLILLARLGSGRMASEQLEEIRLRELVESCFAPHADTARRRNLRFENRIAPELSLSSDKVKLQILIANLLSNAAEYTDEGGWISVESDPPRGVVLMVRDSGPAIPHESVARLFDPFFRLDSSRSGGGEHCGIGLALVRGLCDALGYHVTARNEAGGTIVFTVAR